MASLSPILSGRAPHSTFRLMVSKDGSSLLLSSDGQLLFCGNYAEARLLGYFYLVSYVSSYGSGASRTYRDYNGTITESTSSSTSSIRDGVILQRRATASSSTVSQMTSAAESYDSELFALMQEQIVGREDTLLANKRISLALYSQNLRGNGISFESGSFTRLALGTLGFSRSITATETAASNTLQSDVQRWLRPLCFPTLAPGCPIKIKLELLISGYSAALRRSGTSTASRGYSVVVSGPLKIKTAPIAGSWSDLSVESPLALDGDWTEHEAEIDDVTLASATSVDTTMTTTIETTVPTSRQILLGIDIEKVLTQELYDQIAADSGYSFSSSSWNSSVSVQFDVRVTGLALEVITS